MNAFVKIGVLSKQTKKIWVIQITNDYCKAYEYDSIDAEFVRIMCWARV